MFINVHCHSFLRICNSTIHEQNRTLLTHTLVDIRNAGLNLFINGYSQFSMVVLYTAAMTDTMYRVKTAHKIYSHLDFTILV